MPGSHTGTAIRVAIAASAVSKSERDSLADTKNVQVNAVRRRPSLAGT